MTTSYTQLLFSERTVENYLPRIYSKLGLRGRRDLGALLALGAV